MNFISYVAMHSLKYPNLNEYLSRHMESIDFSYRYTTDDFEYEANRLMTEGELV